MALRSELRRSPKKKRVLRKPAAAKRLPSAATRSGRCTVGGLPLAPGGAAFDRLRPGLRSLVERRRWPGIAACVFVGGELKLLEEWGDADVEAQVPMTSRSLARVYSMTKCVVATAVLQLADAGHLRLDDELRKHLPAFAEMRVVSEGEDGLPKLDGAVPARRPITIRHLLTHTSGIASHFARGLDGPKQRNRRETAWSNIYKDLVDKVDAGELRDLGAWVAEVAKLPLWSHPGAHYGYGYSYDILGHLVELKTGMPLAAYLRSQIFDPLGMSDTRFQLRSGAAKRLSVLYRCTKSGRFGSNGRRRRLVRVDPPRRGASSLWAARCRLPSGGGGLSSLQGGLLSTLDDYAKFLLAVVSGGKHPASGARILSKEAAAEMLADQTDKIYPRPTAHASPYDDRGLGLSCLGELQRKGCPTFGQWFDGVAGVRLWGGAGSTAFKYDPNGGKPILALVMTQALPQDDGKTITDFVRGVREVLAAEEV